MGDGMIYVIDHAKLHNRLANPCKDTEETEDLIFDFLICRKNGYMDLLYISEKSIDLLEKSWPGKQGVITIQRASTREEVEQKDKLAPDRSIEDVTVSLVQNKLLNGYEVTVITDKGSVLAQKLEASKSRAKIVTASEILPKLDELRKKCQTSTF